MYLMYIYINSCRKKGKYNKRDKYKDVLFDKHLFYVIFCETMTTRTFVKSTSNTHSSLLILYFITTILYSIICVKILPNVN